MKNEPNETVDIVNKKAVFLVSLLALALLLLYIAIQGGYFTIVHDVAIKSVTISESELFTGDVVNVTAIVTNEGRSAETFDVTAYYNSTTLETQTVTSLATGEEKALTFSWNTTSASPANYIVKVEAGVVSGETDTADNTYTNGVVRVNRRTLLYVDPAHRVVAVGQNLTVSIVVSDVVDLYGFALELRYNPTILQALDVGEGDFLKRGGAGTFFFPEINNTEGYVYVSSTRLGPIPGADGNGTLARITFRAIAEGVTTIDLYDTRLRDDQPRPIPHITVDGSVEI